MLIRLSSSFNMCSLSIATLTNLPQNGRGLKQHPGLSHGFCSSEVQVQHGSAQLCLLVSSDQIQGVGWAVYLSGGSGEDPTFYLIQDCGRIQFVAAVELRSSFLAGGGTGVSLKSRRPPAFFMGLPLPPSDQQGWVQAFSHCKCIFHTSTAFSFHMSFESR